jgi:hypothetical protein
MLKQKKKTLPISFKSRFLYGKKKVTHSSYYTEAITRHLLRLVLFPEKEIDFNHLLLKKGKKKKFCKCCRSTNSFIKREVNANNNDNLHLSENK